MTKGDRAQRGIVYIRKSVQGDKLSPQTQLGWAIREAQRRGVAVDASEPVLEEMLRARASHRGDIYMDVGISGAVLRRPGFDAFYGRALSDKALTHLFIHRRDRLARPEDPAEAMVIEGALRRAGKTLIFSDKELKPLEHGESDVTGAVLSVVDYHEAREYLKILAERIVACQARLAEDGYWTGGRPPYGFGRFLVDADGTEIRELEEGERVRQPGCHVRIRPNDDDKIEIWLGIVQMHIEQRWGIKRIANELNRRGVRSPDAGRTRRDKCGHVHEVSGKWSLGTISALLRNQAIIGNLTWGTRSEGAHRRIGKDGPRALLDSDFTESGRPRVIRNSRDLQVTRPAGYAPLMCPEKFEQVQATLDARGRSQRGTTRSPDPYRYPLAGRIFDATPGCAWQWCK